MQSVAELVHEMRDVPGNRSEAFVSGVAVSSHGRSRCAALACTMTQKSSSRETSAAGLTAEQLAELRNLLLTKRRELLSEVLRATEGLSEAGNREPEHMDRAESAGELDDRAQRAGRESDLLEEIEAALLRMEDGSYGLSEDSGEPIGYARLQAVPWARRTAREEEEIERSG
jgi:DnaK suppressor protein